MKRYSRLPTFLFILGMALPISSFAETNFWPPLETDQDKLQLMLWDRAMMPNFFQGMVEYEVNYFDVLQRQHLINTQLTGDPHLAYLLQSRPDRVQIDLTLQPAGTGSSGNTAVDPKVLSDYTQKWREALETIPADHRTFEVLKNKILETIKIHRDLSVKNFLNDLINVLPKDRRKAVYPLSIDQKIEIFKNEITDAQLAQLKPQQLKAMAIQSTADIEPVLKSLQQRDRELEDLFGLAIIAMTQNTSIDGSLNLDLAHIQSHQVGVLGDKKTTFQSLKQIFSDNNAKLGAEALAQPRQLFSAAVAPPQETHTMVEVPVDIGWASSCIGGECFTKNMSAYINLPTERRLFVDFTPEGARGFFDVQLVESYGKRYLLANMIQGGSMGPELITECLLALTQRANDLGAEGVMLPTWDNLGSHTNYNDLRDRLRSIVAGKPETSFMYLDNPLREALRPYVNDAGYFTQNSRSKGVIIHSSDLKTANEVSSKTVKAPEFPFYKANISQGEAALIIFEIEEVAGSEDVANRFMHELQVPGDVYASIKSVLMNEQRLATKEYFKSVALALKQYGYDFDTSFKKNRLSSLFPGFLRCPDAWSSNWQKRALNASYGLLQRQGTVGLISESTSSASAQQFDMTKNPQIHEAMLKALDAKYLDRRAAGAILLNFKSDFERVLPVLFGLAHESNGNDEALNQIFRDANSIDPLRFRQSVIIGLYSNDYWTQRGAMIAIEKTGTASPELVKALQSLQHGSARNHDNYLQANYISSVFSNKCEMILLTGH